MIRGVMKHALICINRLKNAGTTYRILALMSRGASHLDGIVPPPKITGLGMNRQGTGGQCAVERLYCYCS
jgi:hypothetical protein